MTLTGILLIIIIGVLTFILRSGNGGKNIYTIIVVLVSSLIALSTLTSCRSHRHTTEEEISIISKMDLTYSRRIDSLFHVLSKQSTATASSTTDVITMDSTVEKEYTDSTGTKVRERATYHNEHHNATNNTTATESTQDNTTQSTESGTTYISDYHSEDKKAEDTSTTKPPFPILINIILINIIFILAGIYITSIILHKK